MSFFSRMLDTFESAESFLENVIDYKGTTRRDGLISVATQIANIEMNQSSVAHHDTLNATAYRQQPYRDDDKRIKLRQRIYSELISKPHLDDDDKIKLGSGGALPKGSIKSEHQAYIVIGLPASGKSGIAQHISDTYGAIIVDSDYAKRKLPEYKQPYGAFVVHNESSSIVMGNSDSSESVLMFAITNGYNVVIPKIGDTSNKIYELASSLKAQKYEVHLILVRLDRVQATNRAVHRFVSTKRYVPLAMIFDEYSNNPTITFYDLMHNIPERKRCIKSFTMLSTDVPREKKFEVWYTTQYSPISKNGEFANEKSKKTNRQGNDNTRGIKARNASHR